MAAPTLGSPLRVRGVASQPIAWSNDDFKDLGREIPLERCLGEMREAGYEGTELGHKFPREASALKKLLDRHGLTLASAWHSAHLLSRPIEDEVTAFSRHADLLARLGANAAIVAECTGSIYTDPDTALRDDSEPNGWGDGDWKRLAASLCRLAEAAAEHGLVLAYHPHMGTGIQGEEEIERLLDAAPSVSLVLDTGHLAFAGVDPASAAERWASRVAHVHLKDVRPNVLRRAREGRWTFEKAIREGVFTVPGDGGIDYAPIFRSLAGAGYSGWLVVEAEQDPRCRDPLVYARMGREHVRKMIGS